MKDELLRQALNVLVMGWEDQPFHGSLRAASELRLALAAHPPQSEPRGLPDGLSAYICERGHNLNAFVRVEGGERKCIECGARVWRVAEFLNHLFTVSAYGELQPVAKELQSGSNPVAIFYCPTCKEEIPAAQVEDTGDCPRHFVEADGGPEGYKPRYHYVVRR